TALLFDAVTYGASALLLSQVKVESLVQAGSSFLAELRDGWSAFVEHTWMWVLVLWIALYFLITYAPFFVLGPYIAKHSMGGAGTWGIVVTGEGIGALAGGLLGLRLRAQRPLIVTGLLFVPTAIQSVLLAFHAPLGLLAPARGRRAAREAVSRRRGNRAARRLAAHDRDVVRLGGRPRVAEHGGQPPPAHPHAAGPACSADRALRRRGVRPRQSARAHRVDR